MTNAMSDARVTTLTGEVREPHVPCDGGFRCHRPRGHATATARVSFSTAHTSGTQLCLLCDPCADVAEAFIATRGAVTRRPL